jgi:hypothetical protein
MLWDVMGKRRLLRQIFKIWNAGIRFLFKKIYRDLFLCLFLGKGGAAPGQT